MTQPKRILHFQGRLGQGGAETFMMNAFREIDRSKYLFDFVIYEDYQDVTPYHDEIQSLGGTIYVVPNPNKNIFGYMKAVKELFQTHHFDIVHNEIFFGGGINLWLAKGAGIKQRVAHSHATTDGKGNKFPHNVLRPFLRRLLLNNATNFLACSHEAGLGLYGQETPFVFVPNGIDLDAYRQVPETKADIRQGLGVPEDAFVVGHIGRFEEQKNHRFLLEIMQTLLAKEPNAYLLAVGTGSLYQKMVELAQKLGIQEHVLFLENRRDIPQLMKAMDVFLLPSLYEGLPMVAVEAQAANVKIVLADTISADTKLSENVTFVKLGASREEWVETILSPPFGNTPLPELAFYDRKNTANLLEEIYE